MALFDAIEPGAGRRLEEYLDSASDTYQMAVDHFLYTSFERPANLAHADVLRRAPRLAGLLGRSLESHVAARFDDPRLRQILGYPAVFLGTSPSRAPSMYHLMSSMDLADGVLYPQGGFTTLIDAIAALARARGRAHPHGRHRDRHRHPLHRPHAAHTGRAGAGRGRHVPHRRGDRADRRRRRRRRDRTCTTSRHGCCPTHLQTYPEAWWKRREPGPGAVLAYLGVEGELPELAHHTMFFTRDWAPNFDDVLGRPGRVPDPASSYVCRPSATDPSVAPPGDENVFILVPVPADVGLGRGGVDGAGDPVVEKTADAAIAQIASWAGVPDFAERASRCGAPWVPATSPPT